MRRRASHRPRARQLTLFCATRSFPSQFADNIWLQAIAIVMPAIAAEEGFRPYPGIRMATFALYTGLIPGAFFWGMTADVWGRRCVETSVPSLRPTTTS